MLRKPRSTKALFSVLIALVAIILSSLACSVDLGGSGNDPSLEETLTALQLTQTALKEQVPDEVPPPAETDLPEPTREPDFTYEGIGLSFDPLVAMGISPETVPAQNMGEDYMPGETYPTYYELTLEGYAIGDHFYTPLIRIYPIAEYRAISSLASESIDHLQQALIDRPQGGIMSGLPFLPLVNAAQVFAANVQYFDFQNSSGVRYLTMFAQAMYPVDNQNFFYTYQGLTNDGQYYISAMLPVIHPELPDDASGMLDDWEAFEANWETYLADIVLWLDEQSAPSFTPNLELLDALMASIQVDR